MPMAISVKDFFDEVRWLISRILRWLCISPAIHRDLIHLFHDLRVVVTFTSISFSSFFGS